MLFQEKPVYIREEVMEKAENCVNKNLYRVFLLVLKVIPYIVSIGSLVYMILYYYGIELKFMDYTFSCSVLPWLFIYISSFLFRFCLYHRIPLYYIAVSDIVNFIDSLYGIPIDTYYYMMLHYIIAGIFILLFIYFKRHARNIRKYFDCNT